MPLHALSRRPSSRQALEITGFCVGSAAAINGAAAQAVDTPPPSGPMTVTVQSDRYRTGDTGLDKLPDSIQDTPQAIDEVTRQTMQEQATTRLQDALRYTPGVTLNSGEGGAHGDNINLRGFATIDNFFTDGIRDPGSYSRDNFNLETVQVLEGPSSVLFGNGQAGGVVNQVSKLPTTAPIRAGTLEFGTNSEFRGTADINQPLGDAAAIRLNVMGEASDTADRDYVHQERWGFAPSITLGMGEPTSFTLSYFYQNENNTPDYGIPFVFGAPAPVPRNTYYGLPADDRTQTEVNVMTAQLRHDFGNGISVTDTLRYGNYWANWRNTSPIFANDFAGGAPVPGTPLSQILVYRDRPSSEGTNTYLTNHTDVTANFTTGPLSHVLVAGVEAARETSDLVRFNNEDQGADGIAPTPLLAPDPHEAFPGTQTLLDSIPSTTSDTVGIYAIDTVKLTSQFKLNLGMRFDRYDTSFDEPISQSHFEQVETAWSPRAALVFTPTDAQSYYVSYSKSFDPVVSYLTLAPDNSAPSPERAKTYEVGAKTSWLGGLLFATVAVFRTDLSNARQSDPDDPTLQTTPGTDQRVQGIELSVTGHVTEDWEVSANYTYLDPTIRSAAGDPDAVGKILPRAARHSANLWTVYDVTEDWKIGTGINYLSRRYADNDNTASLPSYVLWNAMVAYRINDYVGVQLNANNITNALYYDGSYYSDAVENHVIPGAGRTLTLTTSFSF